MPHDIHTGDTGDQGLGISRIPPVSDDMLTPVLQQMHSASVANMSMLFHVMGHRPAIMQHAIELLDATMRGGTVEPQLKELVAVRVSQVNHCSY